MAQLPRRRSASSVDLSIELPPDRYRLCITREVEIELAAIPDTRKDGTDASELKRYIAKSTVQSAVTTTGTFGFQTVEPDGTPSKAQVNLGFGQGCFQSDQGKRAAEAS